MDVEQIPVWSWIPGSVEPVRCGTFFWHDALGQFKYEPAYVETKGAIALDPMSLPFSRSLKVHSETRQNGLFGVMRDASPEGYGLSILEGIEGRALGMLERMERSLGDGVGAIEVCQDIQRKVDFQPPALKEFLARLHDMPEGVPVSRVVRDFHGVHGTTLGGERPKMTVTHDGSFWIAKLQDRGDAPNSPLREYLAMRAARAAGIHACDVELYREGHHQVIAVRRFDREMGADFRVQRHHFASAHTVLRLEANSLRGDRARSYPYLAGELQRWCGAEGVDVNAFKRELWRRMVFNAIVGNGDDHPRNHGLLNVKGQWHLSPAYDIAPYITFSRTLSMSVTRDGHSDAARWALLRDCETFDYKTAEANEYIDHAIETMKSTWEAERDAKGFAPDDAPTPRPEDWLESPPPKDLPTRRRRHS